jgi:hypothetical protein
MTPWLIPLVPFLKGAVGWSAASFLNETIIKPSRSRRRLSHVVAEELSHNLQMLVHQNEYFRLYPGDFPADFHLSEIVSKAILARLGELSDKLTGDLLVFYLRVENINNMTRDLSGVIEAVKEIKRNPDQNGGLSRLEDRREYLRRGMIVYKQSILSAIPQADRLLRQLRVKETLLGRVGYLFRRKPTLNLADAREAAAAQGRKLAP